ncbi:hypothetical protein G6F70_005064 [Rhizopus microsporus]|uniref:Uncharacterized protein n=2 Tax=Rhizopus TaxID=4842 RepID=A0A367K0Y4_RHIAZ|nr:hypothetical protein G6F71_003358 [Rhizopus microsporus]RCH95846.1 hypothetical protein CU097_003705 [Rhizopus azygosporus]KAG1199271.1 hypothetical protein G6F70_005064 [Rhizopus microsporus]KAG1213032.1 hypothetical protein G6F69_003179 [Rhizopus microsporus]KAG1235019.1 hypothetical protein G6F67_003080 [Rhizopus microsporus]
MNCLVFSLLLFFISFSIEQQVTFDADINYGWLTPFTYEWVTVLDRLHNTFGNRSKTEQCLHKIPKFECERFVWDDSIIHRDAYHLRPNDIKSVIALGDSITAGFGMMSGRPPFSTILEYRGKSFSVGGDPGEYTLPNFLSTYADELKGSPEGITLPLSRGKDLNNAITGAKCQDLDQQVDRLIRVLKKKEYKDIRDEWKLITIFIGANNICVLCTPPMTTLPDLSAADVFERNLRSVLERIRQDVGKSFVNLVGLFNVSGVYEATRGDPYCELIWDPAHMAICSCVQQDTKQRLAADKLIDEYNKRLQKLEREYKDKDKQTFGISYQPGFTQFDVGKYKQAYFSGVDCFHPNKCANQNMFSNPQEKNKIYDLESLEIVCPSPTRPYVQ